MTPPRRFEEVMAERIKLLDDIRATIERIRWLIDIMAEQINLEQQWAKANSNPELNLDRQTSQNLGDGA